MLSNDTALLFAFLGDLPEILWFRRIGRYPPLVLGFREEMEELVELSPD